MYRDHYKPCCIAAGGSGWGEIIYKSGYPKFHASGSAPTNGMILIHTIRILGRYWCIYSLKSMCKARGRGRGRGDVRKSFNQLCYMCMCVQAGVLQYSCYMLWRLIMCLLLVTVGTMMISIPLTGWETGIEIVWGTKDWTRTESWAGRVGPRSSGMLDLDGSLSSLLESALGYWQVYTSVDIGDVYMYPNMSGSLEFPCMCLDSRVFSVVLQSMGKPGMLQMWGDH